MTAMTPLRVAVLSSTAFGYQCIADSILPLSQIELAGILTTPREIEISYSKKPVTISTHVRFDNIADLTGCEIAILSGKMNSDKYLQYIHRWTPHLLLALGWYYIIPRKVRESTPLGCAGIHASLLPKYRGGAPIPWAIINGEKETGVTFFYFDDGVDTGDIIAQKSFSIDDVDTCRTVYEKANQASIDLLKEYLPMMSAGHAPRFAQDETKATVFPQRRPEDGLIDWSWDAKRIQNFIRAQTKPYPGAFTYIEGKKVTIWDATVVNHDGCADG
ncbi:methionyl-tRNA formyltransferase [Chloroflexi bacterium TSY]|nr:methionyl-tRNA formyltransferase [Chloroflexi bacterium TSY]